VTHEILVIDDDMLTRWALKTVLTRAGYHVREAGSAKEGLMRARERVPNLVLLDFRLPDRNGAFVLQSLLQSQPTPLVVMMSANATEETVRYLRRLGASGYLTKPCAPAFLVAQVDGLLQPPVRHAPDVHGRLRMQSDPSSDG
jgi:DNA-binding response OmpR family regulator